MKMRRMMPDISSILYLTLARKTYCNLYRFTMTMNEDVDSVVLQKAADNIRDRFSVFMCGFESGFFHDTQAVHDVRIQVIKDTQFLRILSKEEIKNCPARILYAENRLSIELFHALTDGYGAVAYISTLTAEYLRLRYNTEIPSGYPIMDVTEETREEEFVDEYFNHCADKPAKLSKVVAYQLPRENRNHTIIRPTQKVLSMSEIKNMAKNQGVSPTTFLSEIMAESFMKHQLNHSDSHKPVRIMIPVNLRGFFPNKTFRNFIETVHVTLNKEDLKKSFSERLTQFKEEMKSQLNVEHLGGMIKAHVSLQQSVFFKMIPTKLKYLVFKIGYGVFGEINSTLTFTNLGVVNLPPEMHPYVNKIDCFLSPRAGSPYNCAMIVYQGQIALNFSSFNKNDEVEENFWQHLTKIMEEQKSF